MARWQPPIPSGALWSKPARDLGPALALLAYAYDCIQGDGSLEINLHEVAGDMNEPYPTVKRWWATLRNGPFFASVTDRGRSGIKAQFSEDWIDRRILAKRNQETGSQLIPITDSPTRNTGSEVISIDTSEPEMAPNRDIIGTETGSLLNAAYIGTHNTQIDMSIAPVASGDAPTPAPRVKKPKADKSAEPPTPIAIRLTIADVCSIDLDGGTATKGQITNLNTTAKTIWATAQRQGKTEQECIDAIKYVAGWIKRTVYPYSNGQPLKPAALLERWKGAMEARAKATLTYANGANGHQPAERLPTPAETAAIAQRYPRFPGRPE